MPPLPEPEFWVAIKWLLLAGSGAAAVAAIHTFVTIKIKRAMYGPIVPRDTANGRRDDTLLPEIIALTDKMIVAHKAVAESNFKLALSFDGLRATLAENVRMIHDSARKHDSSLREMANAFKDHLTLVCRFRK